MAGLGGKLTAVLLAFQVIFIVLFAIFVRYDATADAKHDSNNKDMVKGGADPDNNVVGSYYPMFQDVQVMIFIGFGFLMTFLKKYGFGSLGFNFLIASFAIQWATLLTCFWHIEHGVAGISITTMITSDFAAAAVLISFGAVLGKASPLQLTVMTFIELIFFNVNEHIGLTYFKAVDAGGSMFVHTFGAYFGITVARILYKKGTDENENEGSVYHSDMFSMIGTIFLWMFWPAFNSALVPAEAQHRAVMNTYYSLAACCVTAFAVSSLLGEGRKKLDMVHIQNSTLAGGVAVGTCADLMIQPWGAMLIGMVAGLLSVVGYKFLTPFFNKHKFHDTCGVNNLHGMPGIMAAIAGIVASAIASTDIYGLNLYTVFPARAPLNGTAEIILIQNDFSKIEAGDNRSAGAQAAYQLAALGMTMGMAIVGGAITGFLLRLSFWDQPAAEYTYEDRLFWEIPEHGYSPYVGENPPQSAEDQEMQSQKPAIVIEAEA